MTPTQREALCTHPDILALLTMVSVWLSHYPCGDPAQRAAHEAAIIERLATAMASLAEVKPEPVIPSLSKGVPKIGAEMEAALVRYGHLPSPIVGAVEAIGHEETKWWVVFRGTVLVQAYNFIRDEIWSPL